VLGAQKKGKCGNEERNNPFKRVLAAWGAGSGQDTRRGRGVLGATPILPVKQFAGSRGPLVYLKDKRKERRERFGKTSLTSNGALRCGKAIRLAPTRCITQNESGDKTAHLAGEEVCECVADKKKKKKLPKSRGRTVRKKGGGGRNRDRLLMQNSHLDSRRYSFEDGEEKKGKRKGIARTNSKAEVGKNSCVSTFRIMKGGRSRRGNWARCHKVRAQASWGREPAPKTGATKEKMEEQLFLQGGGEKKKKKKGVPHGR